jgi:hypothetical protein
VTHQEENDEKIFRGCGFVFGAALVFSPAGATYNSTIDGLVTDLGQIPADAEARKKYDCHSDGRKNVRFHGADRL